MDNIFPGKVSELATVKGLSYTLIYNLVHGRIHSLSKSDYRRIFGEEPPLPGTRKGRWRSVQGHGQALVVFEYGDNGGGSLRGIL